MLRNESNVEGRQGRRTKKTKDTHKIASSIYFFSFLAGIERNLSNKSSSGIDFNSNHSTKP